MMAPFFFALGLVNNICLIIVFVLRRRRIDIVQRFGWLYLGLAIPTVHGLVLAQREGGRGEYTIFLAIFLAFLAMEGLYDWVLKLPFRETMDWRLLLPYVALYIASSYGFVVMSWRFYSVVAGILMMVLTVAQLVANAVTHTRTKPPRESSKPERCTAMRIPLSRSARGRCPASSLPRSVSGLPGEELAQVSHDERVVVQLGQPGHAHRADDRPTAQTQRHDASVGGELDGVETGVAVEVLSLDPEALPHGEGRLGDADSDRQFLVCRRLSHPRPQQPCVIEGEVGKAQLRFLRLQLVGQLAHLLLLATHGHSRR